jgi:type IV pilus assembly protein PilC
VIVSPGQLTQRAEFYHQLSQLTGAGLGVVQALGQIKRNPPARSYRKPVEQTLAEIGNGANLSDSLRRVPQWLPEFDVTLVEAGEKSGRLDASFRLLADYYTDRARLARQMIADLLYPVFLFHFTVFIAAFIQFVRSGNWAIILVGGLAPVYALTLFSIYAAQSKRGETWRAQMERLLAPVPVLGTARRYLALGRLAAALEALIGAGVNIIDAWEMAASASGSPALRRTVKAWRPQINAGETPAEVVFGSGRFPELFANQYHSGEVSGKLDDTLKRLHRFYQEEGTRLMHMVAQWVPRFVYLVAALIAAIFIVRFWSGRFQQIRDAGVF